MARHQGNPGCGHHTRCVAVRRYNPRAYQYQQCTGQWIVAPPDDCSQDILDSSSLSVTNTNAFAVEIDVVVGANGYSDIASFFTSGSGTILLSDGSTVVNEWWIRPGASQPGVDPFDPSRPGTLLHSFMDTAVGAAYSYSDSSGPIPVLVTGAYGLEQIFRVTLAAGGSLTSRGQVAIGIEEVPEPASLALVGLGGLAIAFVRRQKAHEA